MDTGTLAGCRPRTSRDAPTTENTSDTATSDTLPDDGSDGEPCELCGAPAVGHAATWDRESVADYIEATGQPPGGSIPVCKSCGDTLNEIDDRWSDNRGDLA